MLPAGFETAIPAASDRKTHALDRAATGIGRAFNVMSLINRYN
jgi:hypothetical protein